MHNVISDRFRAIRYKDDGLILLVGAIIAVASGFYYWPRPPYSPDTWAYFELSHSLRDGHYSLQLRTKLQREFHIRP